MLIKQLVGSVVVQRRGLRTCLLHVVDWVELRRHSLPPVLRYVGGIAALAQIRRLGDAGELRRVPDFDAPRVRDVDIPTVIVLVPFIVILAWPVSTVVPP